MKFFSNDFDDYQPLPAEFTADGRNVNPSFKIDDVPSGAKSLVLLAHDPDASNGGDWLHWLVWNIDSKVTAIAKAAEPAGVAGRNDFGQTGYSGPDPVAGSGVHRYVFELFALDGPLPLGQSASRQDVMGAMRGHILAQSMWVGTYQR